MWWFLQWTSRTSNSTTQSVAFIFKIIMDPSRNGTENNCVRICANGQTVTFTAYESIVKHTNMCTGSTMKRRNRLIRLNRNRNWIKFSVGTYRLHKWPTGVREKQFNYLSDVNVFKLLWKKEKLFLFRIDELKALYLSRVKIPLLYG